MKSVEYEYNLRRTKDLPFLLSFICILFFWAAYKYHYFMFPYFVIGLSLIAFVPFIILFIVFKNDPKGTRECDKIIFLEDSIMVPKGLLKIEYKTYPYRTILYVSKVRKRLGRRTGYYLLVRTKRGSFRIYDWPLECALSKIHEEILKRVPHSAQIEEHSRLFDVILPFITIHYAFYLILSNSIPPDYVLYPGCSLIIRRVLKRFF